VARRATAVGVYEAFRTPSEMKSREFAKKASRNGPLAYMRGPSGALSCGCLYQARGGGPTPHSYPRPLFT